MTAEIRGNGNEWSVWYENETALKSPVPVYRCTDRGNDLLAHDANVRGELVGVAFVDGLVPMKSDVLGKGRFVPSYFTGTKKECEEHARFLGATEVTVRRTQPRAPRAADVQTELDLALSA